MVFFRVPDTANFLVANSNILRGTGGIGENQILFYSDKPDNNDHFAMNNTVVNGVAFWTMANTGGGIDIQNAQGCTQLVADKIDLSNVRFTRCAYEGEPQVPEPGALALLVGGLAALAIWRRVDRRPTSSS